MTTSAGQRLGAKLETLAASLKADERSVLVDLKAFAELGCSVSALLGALGVQLQLMQDEQRSFTLVSNVMKTKRDPVKESISNIR